MIRILNRRNKLLHSLAVGLLVGFIGAATPNIAFADIDRAKASEIAKKHRKGKVLKVTKVDTKKGKAFRVKILQKSGKVTQVMVDAKKGKVVSSSSQKKNSKKQR